MIHNHDNVHNGVGSKYLATAKLHQNDLSASRFCMVTIHI